MDVAICLLINNRCRDPQVWRRPKTAKTTFSAAAIAI
jgi:hypothetical protein